MTARDIIDLPIPQASGMGIELRVMSDADLMFTAQVYAATRQEELAVTGWPQAQIDAFLAQQHAAQHHHYTTHYPGLARYAIRRAGDDVGRLYLYIGQDDVRIVDIALLPPARNRGIGAALLTDIIAHAAGRAMRVSIHVERNNPARRLYERCGFTRVADANGLYELMAWHPPGHPLGATMGAGNQ